MTYPLLIVLAFTMASKEPDFEAFVKKHDEAFTDWREQNPGDFKAYLDAKVLEFIIPKDVKILKKQVYLLALYRVKNEPVSAILNEYSKKYEEMLRGLDMDKLTWQELFDKIKSFNRNEKENEHVK